MESLDKGELNGFLGKRFEKFIRDHLLFFFKDFRIGQRWWYQTAEIDVVSINVETKEILFGECKWKGNINARQSFGQLKQKVHFVKWYNEKRREILAVFAKSFKEKISEWQGHEVFCFDLQDIEALMSH